MPPEDRNRLDELKKSLYSRTGPNVRTRRKLRFTEKESDVKRSWDPAAEPSAPLVLNKKYEDHSMSFFTKLLIGSAIFCIIAVGLGAYLFFNGSNLISANNIDIQVNGPVSVPGGEVVPFDITVTNKNGVDLQLADLSVTFPAGATDPDNPAKELTNFRVLLGDIPAGRSVTKTVKAIIFGEENLQKQIGVEVSYSVKGSTSLFTKNTSYDILINSSPIGVTVDSFKEITSGQEFDMTVNLKSNSDQTLKNVLLKASYPFGYTFMSASVKPAADNATWKIGDIPAGGSRSIRIHGKLSGENADTRAFHFTVGAQSSSDPGVIGTQFMAVEQDVAIQKPFISLSLGIDGDTSSADAVAKFGESKRMQVSWFNNLSVPVSNVEITVRLSGSAYDPMSVQPDLGYYRSSTNDIVWNQQTTQDLGSVRAGGSGSVYFTIIPKDPSAAGSLVTNPFITVSASVTGNRTQETQVPQALAATVARTVKITPSISLTGRLLRNAGPFANTGPIPPRVNQSTTYTVTWTVDNTSSSLENAQVTATLPAYVKWAGKTSPDSEKLSYDKNSGTVTWNIGGVPTYTASSGRRKEASFQISYEPSASQAGQTPTLVNPQTLTATDSYTKARVEDSQDFLSTRFSTDPAYRDGDETVAR